MLQEKFDELSSFYEHSGIRAWRNKVLAHADLLTLSGQTDINVKFSNCEVESFVADMQDFIDWLSDHRVSTDHQVVLPRGSDGYSFINKVKLQNES